MAGFSEKARLRIRAVRFLFAALLCLPCSSLFGFDSSSDNRSFGNTQVSPFVLHEAYVLLQTGRYTGDPFYRVLMDDEEQPYINVSDILKNWLGLSDNCDVIKKRCHATLHVTNQSFWIDAGIMEYGEGPYKKNRQSLPNQILVFQEKKLWLRYDFWDRWIPVNTTWNRKEYKLRIIPKFPNKSDVQRARAEIRNSAKNRLKRKQEIDAREAITPKKKFHSELRYRIGHEQYTRAADRRSWLKIDTNSDLWQGTLKISVSETKYEGNGESSVTDVSMWNYRRLHNPYFHLLELGNMVSDNSLLIPRTVAENGLKLHRLDNSSASDLVGFSGTAPPGTEIDLYYFGFILESMIVGNDGTYAFDEAPVPGGDRIRLRFYYPDGSSEEKVVQVAPDNGWLIPENDWNSRLFTGSATWGNHSRFDIGYGFTEDFSLGLQANHISLESVGPVSLNGAYMVWRPISGLYLLTEALNAKRGTDTAASIEVTHFYPQFISYSFHRLTETSPLLHIMSGDKQSTKYDKVTYSFSKATWQLYAENIVTEKREKTRVNLRRRLTGRLSAYLETSRSQAGDLQEERSNKLGAELSTFNHSVRCERTVGNVEANRSWFASYRYKNDDDTLYGSTSLRIPDEGDTTFVASLTWKPTPKIATGINKYVENGSAWAQWSDVLAPSPGPKTWDDYAHGTLTGKVYAPAKKGRLGAPMVGVVVKAGSKSGVTDSKGNYVITGLPVEQRIEVTLNTSSLDIGLIPKEDVAIVYFRPGTHINHDIELINSAGADGYIELDADQADSVIIEVIRVADRNVIKIVPVEADGFFIIEGLRPDLYELVVSGGPVVFPAFSLEIKPGDVWIPEIKIQPVTNQEFPSNLKK